MTGESVRRDGRTRASLTPIRHRVPCVNELLQHRLIGIQLLALCLTFAGELLDVSILVTVGVTGFFLALFGLLAVMSVALAVGLTRTDGPQMLGPSAGSRSG